MAKRDSEAELHAAAIDSLEQRIMDLALERTGARSGALFLVDEKQDALRIDFHVIEGVIAQLPNMLLRRRLDGRPNGIAFWCADENKPYLCEDSRNDPNYAKYFQEVRSILAAPIPYQQRAIGVISVSAKEPGVFTPAHLDELVALAASSAIHLRRAQLFRAKHREEGRVVLIKGISPEWVEVERTIERVAPSQVPVLIRGESGTGKELVAHAIHFNSARSRKPFIVVNCAAIPETLLESALFGHVKGAYTGAVASRIGEFKRADGGTLFLDEVGELTPPLQAKLLRAIEQGEVSPLGSHEAAQRVDVRVLGATNRPLEEMMRDGRFREDLYHRLSVVTVSLPPLRSCKANLATLAELFLAQANERHQRAVEGVTPEAMAALQAYDFPGNVRELRNLIERSVLMAAGPVIGVADLPPQVRNAATAVAGPAAATAPSGVAFPTLEAAREAALAPVEREYFTRLVEAAEGNMRLASRLAGVNASTLYRLMKKRGIKVSRVVR